MGMSRLHTAHSHRTPPSSLRLLIYAMDSRRREVPLYRKGVNLLTAAFVSASLLLMTTALLWPSWLQLNYLQGPLIMGINQCTNCNGMLKSWSWECLKHLHCIVMENDALCDVYNRSNKAMILFCSMDSLAIVFNLMLLERYLAYLLDRDYGSPRLLRLLSVLVIAGHGTALGTYFSMTQASFDQNCVALLSPQGAPKLCIQEGPIISLAAGVCQFFMVILLNVSFSSRDRSRDQGIWIRSPRVYFLSMKVWMRVLFVMHLAVYFFAISGVLTVNWVKRESQTEEWSGGLLRCDTCPFTSEQGVLLTQGWDCLSGWLCNFDTASGQCKLFSHIRDAGRNVNATSVFRYGADRPRADAALDRSDRHDGPRAGVRLPQG